MTLEPVYSITGYRCTKCNANVAKSIAGFHSCTSVKYPEKTEEQLKAENKIRNDAWKVIWERLGSEDGKTS